MFVLQVNIRIKPENVDAFMKKLDENARAARSEKGCRQFECFWCHRSTCATSGAVTRA